MRDDFFVVIAECAVAFAGFAALIVIIPRLAGVPWHGKMATGLWLMVAWNLSAFFFSLLPMVLTAFGLTAISALRWSSGLLGVAILIQGALASARDAKLPEGENGAEPRRAIRATAILGVSTAAILLASGLGLMPTLLEGVYMGSLLILFVLAAVPLALFLAQLGSGR